MSRKNEAPAGSETGTGRVSNAAATDTRTIAGPSGGSNLLETSPFAIDGGEMIGRDPRTLSAEDWQAAGITRLTGMQAIRAACLSCVYTAAEVRKCVCTDCPLWPYRLGTVPKGLRDAEAQGGTKTDLSSPKRDAEGMP